MTQVVCAIARRSRRSHLHPRDYALAHGPALGPPGTRDRLESWPPDRFVRQITTFVPNDDGSWRRDDETHLNVLVDTDRVPAPPAAEGVAVTMASAFGTEHLPAGLRVLIGRRVTGVSGG